MNLEDTTPLAQYLKTSAKFLRYSLEDVDYSYDGLTKAEKALCTREEFEALVQWVKAH